MTTPLYLNYSLQRKFSSLRIEKNENFLLIGNQFFVKSDTRAMKFERLYIFVHNIVPFMYN